MSYTTRAALEARRGTRTLAVLADADQDGSEDLGTVEATIAAVDALIDSALAIRWPAVVGRPTAVLGMIAVDLVIGRLATGLARSEEIIEAEARAEKRLAAVAAGDLDPDPGAAGATPDTSGNSLARAWAGEAFGDRATLRRVL